MPPEWSKTLMTMLQKKGDRKNPGNYHGIALCNTMLKLFTSIILKRLTIWTDDCNILVEGQSGFRKGRSCLDNIFTLNAVVSLHLRLPGRHIYAVFVDFKRAFDSVNHDLLWSKLHHLGISVRIVQVLGVYMAMPHLGSDQMEA